MESDEMRSDWFGCVCKSGETLFYYNIKTGEHRLANDLTVSENSIFRISINDLVPKPKELCSMGTQTEDYGCINGCSSIYAEKEIEKDNTMMNSSALNDNERCYNRTRNCHETVINIVSVENNHYLASEKVISKQGDDKEIEMDEDLCSDGYHGERHEGMSDCVTDSCHSRESYCDLQEDLPNTENDDCKSQELNNHSALSDSCHSRATSCDLHEDVPKYIEGADGKESMNDCTVTETCEQRCDLEDLPNLGNEMQESDCNSIETDRCHSHGFLTHPQVEKGSFNCHERTQTGEMPYECSYCDKAFARKGNLKRHLRTHTGEKPYECSYCDKAFAQKNDLKCHIRTHTGEKPYECSYCDKAFAEKGSLKRHLRTHTNEKPYECSYCDRAFARKSNLNDHLRTHTDDKPYECLYCDKAFARKSNLNCHLRTHTGEKPYECFYCDKAFAQKSNRNYHLKTHTGEKAYECS